MSNNKNISGISVADIVSNSAKNKASLNSTNSSSTTTKNLSGISVNDIINTTSGLSSTFNRLSKVGINPLTGTKIQTTDQKIAEAKTKALRTQRYKDYSSGVASLWNNTRGLSSEAQKTYIDNWLKDSNNMKNFRTVYGGADAYDTVLSDIYKYNAYTDGGTSTTDGGSEQTGTFKSFAPTTNTNIATAHAKAIEAADLNKQVAQARTEQAANNRSYSLTDQQNAINLATLQAANNLDPDSDTYMQDAETVLDGLNENIKNTPSSISHYVKAETSTSKKKEEALANSDDPEDQKKYQQIQEYRNWVTSRDLLQNDVDSKNKTIKTTAAVSKYVTTDADGNDTLDVDAAKTDIQSILTDPNSTAEDIANTVTIMNYIIDNTDMSPDEVRELNSWAKDLSTATKTEYKGTNRTENEQVDLTTAKNTANDNYYKATSANDNAQLRYYAASQIFSKAYSVVNENETSGLTNEDWTLARWYNAQTDSTIAGSYLKDSNFTNSEIYQNYQAYIEENNAGHTQGRSGLLKYISETYGYDEDYFKEMAEQVRFHDDAEYTAKVKAENAKVVNDSGFWANVAGTQNVEAVAQNFVGGPVSLIEDIKSLWYYDKDAPVDVNSRYYLPTQLATATRDAVQEKYNWDEKTQIGTRKIDVFDELYGIWTSSLDSGLAMVVGGALGIGVGAGAAAESAAVKLGASAATAAKVGSYAGQLIGGSLIGSQAAASTIIDSVNNGATGDTALWNGLLAGTWETVFETWSISKLLESTAVKGLKGIGKSLGTAFVTNGSEELNTEIADVITELATLGGVSSYARGIIDYINAGYTEDQARALAAKDLTFRCAEAGVTGAIQGVFMGSFTTAKNYVLTKQATARTQELQQMTGIASEAIPELTNYLLSDGTQSQKMAQDLYNKIKEAHMNGASEEELRTQINAGLADIREVAQNEEISTQAFTDEDISGLNYKQQLGIIMLKAANADNAHAVQYSEALYNFLTGETTEISDQLIEDLGLKSRIRGSVTSVIQNETGVEINAEDSEENIKSGLKKAAEQVTNPISGVHSAVAALAAEMQVQADRENRTVMAVNTATGVERPVTRDVFINEWLEAHLDAGETGRQQAIAEFEARYNAQVEDDINAKIKAENNPDYIKENVEIDNLKSRLLAAGERSEIEAKRKANAVKKIIAGKELTNKELNALLVTKNGAIVADARNTMIGIVLSKELGHPVSLDNLTAFRASVRQGRTTTTAAATETKANTGAEAFNPNSRKSRRTEGTRQLTGAWQQVKSENKVQTETATNTEAESASSEVETVPLSGNTEESTTEQVDAAEELAKSDPGVKAQNEIHEEFAEAESEAVEANDASKIVEAVVRTAEGFNSLIAAQRESQRLTIEAQLGAMYTEAALRSLYAKYGSNSLKNLKLRLIYNADLGENGKYTRSGHLGADGHMYGLITINTAFCRTAEDIISTALGHEFSHLVEDRTDSFGWFATSAGAQYRESIIQAFENNKYLRSGLPDELRSLFDENGKISQNSVDLYRNRVVWSYVHERYGYDAVKKMSDEERASAFNSMLGELIAANEGKGLGLGDLGDAAIRQEIANDLMGRLITNPVLPAIGVDVLNKLLTEPKTRKGFQRLRDNFLNGATNKFIQELIHSDELETITDRRTAAFMKSRNIYAQNEGSAIKAINDSVQNIFSAMDNALTVTEMAWKDQLALHQAETKAEAEDQAERDAAKADVLAMQEEMQNEDDEKLEDLKAQLRDAIFTKESKESITGIQIQINKQEQRMGRELSEYDDEGYIVGDERRSRIIVNADRVDDVTSDNLKKYQKDYLRAIIKAEQNSGRTISLEGVDKYLNKYPDIDFVYRITTEGDKAKNDLKNFVNQIDDVEVLKWFAWYGMGEVFRNQSWISNDVKKARASYSRIIFNRINALKAQKVNSTPLNLDVGGISLAETRLMFDRLNSIKELDDVADKVFKVAGQLGLTINIVVHPGIGRYNNFKEEKDADGLTIGNYVEYKRSYFNSGRVTDQDKASVILHELIHVCTSYALFTNNELFSARKGLNPDILTEGQKNACDTLEKIFNQIHGDPLFQYKNGKRMYGTTDVHEMVAEFSNASFREKLQQRGLWGFIVDALRNFFGFKTKTASAFDGIDAALNYLLDNPNVDAYRAFAKAAAGVYTAQYDARGDTEEVRNLIAPLDETGKQGLKLDNVEPDITNMPSRNSNFLYKNKAEKSLVDILSSDTKRTLMTVKDSNGNYVPVLKSGREVLEEALKAKGLNTEEIDAALKVLDDMADWMDWAELEYKFVGLKDINRAKLVLSREKDGTRSIAISALVKNGEYPINFDLTKVCAQRVAVEHFIEELAARPGKNGGESMLEEVQLTQHNLFKLNELLKNEGYETACLGCFVESRRYNIQSWMDKFLAKWNSAVEAINPNAEYFNFAEPADEGINVETMSKEELTKFWDDMERYKLNMQTAAIEKRKALNKDKANLNNEEKINVLVKSSEAYQKKLRPADLITPQGRTKLHAQMEELESLILGHYGSNTPKSIELFTPYNNEIELMSDEVSGTPLKDYLAKIAGVRSQSFSDFIITHVFDVMQKTAALYARGLKAHVYTKVISRAVLFGLTNEKHNLSVLNNIDTRVDAAHAGFTIANGDEDVPVIEPGDDGKKKLTWRKAEKGELILYIGDKENSERALKNKGERDFVQSIPYKQAINLQMSEGYSANCGIVGVGYSYYHNLEMLMSDVYGYIIGYHKSGMPVDVAIATNINLATDYTKVQNTCAIGMFHYVANEWEGVPSYASWAPGVKEYVKGEKAFTMEEGEANDLVLDVRTYLNKAIASGVKYPGFEAIRSFLAYLNKNRLTFDTKKAEVDGEAQHGVGNFSLYTGLNDGQATSLEYTNDPMATADAYIQWCLSKGFMPEFYEFTLSNGYYKFLYDFTVYDHLTGEYAPQKDVEMNFPENFQGLVNGYMSEYNDYMQRQFNDKKSNAVLDRAYDILSTPEESQKVQRLKAAQFSALNQGNYDHDFSKASDILTYAEAAKNTDSYAVDFNEGMATEAIRSGKVTAYPTKLGYSGALIYSSGVPVTLSLVEAQQAQGTKSKSKLKSGNMSISDIAWIDATHGITIKVDKKYKPESAMGAVEGESSDVEDESADESPARSSRVTIRNATANAVSDIMHDSGVDVDPVAAEFTDAFVGESGHVERKSRVGSKISQGKENLVEDDMDRRIVVINGRKFAVGYKLFRTEPSKPGNIYPLFVDAKNALDLGSEMDAEDTQSVLMKAKNGELVKRVLSTLGDASKFEFSLYDENGNYQFDLWESGKDYKVGQRVTYEDKIYLRVEGTNYSADDVPSKKKNSSGWKLSKSATTMAYRPGWHSGVLPYLEHIGMKSMLVASDYKAYDPNATYKEGDYVLSGKYEDGSDQIWRRVKKEAKANRTDAKAAPGEENAMWALSTTSVDVTHYNSNHVWAEVLVPINVDYQEAAHKNGEYKDKNGNDKFAAKDADLDYIPVDGSYVYKTNSNMRGAWLISGSVLINRLLSDQETRDILDKTNAEHPGYDPLIQRKRMNSKHEVVGDIDLAALGLEKYTAGKFDKYIDVDKAYAEYLKSEEQAKKAEAFSRKSRNVTYEAPEKSYNIPDGMGIFIRNTGKHFVDHIFDGTKTIETRNDRTLDAFIDNWVPIIKTETKEILGYAYIDGVKEYTSYEDFHEDDSKHLVTGGAYDWKNGKKKYGYTISRTAKLDQPYKLSQNSNRYGRIAAEVSGSTAFRRHEYKNPATVKETEKKDNNIKEFDSADSWESYELDMQFQIEVDFSEKHSFLRSLADKTKGIKPGEHREVSILCGDHIYIFDAVGYMNGGIIDKYGYDDIKSTGRKDYAGAVRDEFYPNGRDADKSTVRGSGAVENSGNDLHRTQGGTSTARNGELSSEESSTGGAASFTRVRQNTNGVSTSQKTEKRTPKLAGQVIHNRPGEAFYIDRDGRAVIVNNDSTIERESRHISPSRTDKNEVNVNRLGKPEGTVTESKLMTDRQALEATRQALRKKYTSIRGETMIEAAKANPTGAKNDVASAKVKTKTSKFYTNTLAHSFILDSATLADPAVLAAAETNRSTEELSVKAAIARLTDVGDESAYKDIISKDSTSWSNVDMDVAYALLYSEKEKARKSGNYDRVVKLVETMAKANTEAGRVIQANAKYSSKAEGIIVRACKDIYKTQLSPEDRKVVLAEVASFVDTVSLINEGDENAKKEILKMVYRAAELRGNALTDKQKAKLEHMDFQFQKKLALSQAALFVDDFIERAKAQKVNAWHNGSLLLNFHTDLVNRASNLTYRGLEAHMANTVAVGIDSIIAAISGTDRVVRNVSLTGKAAKEQGIRRRDMKELEVALDVMPDERERYKYTKPTRTFKGNAASAFERGVSKLERQLGYELNVTDEYTKGKYEGELRAAYADDLKNGKITQQELDALIEDEELQGTFQNSNLFNAAMGEIKDFLNAVPGLGIGDTGRTFHNVKELKIHEIGLGDFLIKYTQVAGALIQTSLEFSPVGMAKVLYNTASIARNGGFKNMSFETRYKYAMTIGRCVTGSALAALFGVLSQLGIVIVGGDDDDDDKSADDRSSGVSGVSLNLSKLGRLISGLEGVDDAWENNKDAQDGDILIDFANIEPFNFTMIVGARLAKNMREGQGAVGATWSALWTSFAEMISDMSMMTTINNLRDTLKYAPDDSQWYDYLFDVGLTIGSTAVTSFIPTIVRQSARATDQYYRDVYGSDSNLGDAWRQIANSVPGLRYTLPTKQTGFGESKTYNQGVVGQVFNAANAFFLPGNVNITHKSNNQEMISDNYYETGDAKTYANRNALYSMDNTVYKLGDDGKATDEKFDEKVELNEKQRRKYQETYGTTYDQVLSVAKSSSYFSSASAAEKASIMAAANNYATYIAKKEAYLDLGYSFTDSSQEKISEAIKSGMNPLDFLYIKTELDGVTGETKNGKTVTNSKKNNAKAIILSYAGLTSEQRELLLQTVSSNYSWN